MHLLDLAQVETVVSKNILKTLVKIDRPEALVRTGLLLALEANDLIVQTDLLEVQGKTGQQEVIVTTDPLEVRVKSDRREDLETLLPQGT